MKHERAVAALATAAGMMVVATFVAGKAARDATLLSQVPVTSLPMYVGIAAVLTFPLVLFTSRALGRIGPARLMPILCLGSAGLLIAEWLTIDRWPRLATAVVYFHLAAVGPVLVSGFWSTINERFEPRAAKRRIGTIGLGATLGGVLGGVIAERTAHLASSTAILMILGGLHIACAVVLFVLGRGSQHVRVVDDARPWAAVRVIARSSLLREIALLVVLSAMGAAALDYVFKSDLMQRNSSAPLRSLGLYHTITNIATALVQLVVTTKLVRRIGAPRGVVSLPATVLGFGGLAFFMPTSGISMLTRGAEVVVRSSVYRASYELLFTPLAAADKRLSKVLIDVGADRLGDLLAAQLLAALLFTAPSPRAAILVAAAALATLAIIVALDIRRTYTRTLEQRLLDGSPTTADQPWASLHGFGEDAATLSLLRVSVDDEPASSSPDLRAEGVHPAQRSDEREAAADRRPDSADELAHPTYAGSAAERVHPAGGATLAGGAVLHGSATQIDLPRPNASPAGATLVESRPSGRIDNATGRRAATSTSELREMRDPAIADLVDLRSGNEARVRRVLSSPLPLDVASHVLPLLAWESVSDAARAALQAIAPQVTGQLIDALLDQSREFSIRRRLPEIIRHGAPDLAVWGLWRALRDPRFEVRYRSGKALGKLHDGGHALAISQEEVFEAVRREVTVDGRLWHSHRLLDGHGGDDDDAVLHRVLEQRSATGLDHVFTLLGLTLPAEPLRLALQAVSTRDPALRGTALEYLESVLPEEVRAPLWPFLEVDRATQPATRRPDEIVAALRVSHPSIISDLRAQRTPDGRSDVLARIQRGYAASREAAAGSPPPAAAVADRADRASTASDHASSDTTARERRR